jgi:hypothetical protein
MPSRYSSLYSYSGVPQSTASDSVIPIGQLSNNFEMQIQVKEGAVPQNTENLEKLIDRHPFTHQVKLTFLNLSHSGVIILA